MKKLCLKTISFFLSVTVFLVVSCLSVRASESIETDDLLNLADLSAVQDYAVGIPLIPADSRKPSSILALQMLALSSGYSADDFSALFASAGFEVLKQSNFDKDIEDPSHTGAYTIGIGSVMKGLVPRDAILLSFRGTYGGEWYSNFDFCPSRNTSALFAENFLYAAEDAFLELIRYTDAYPDALILICGHSRGAACANLLGLLMNEYDDSSRIYVYTFATPATMRPGTSSYDDGNIFNYINPCDMVPMLPLAQWDYVRAGTDILLPQADPALEGIVTSYAETFAQITPTVTSYYESRRALDHAGTDENGLTAFELMLLLCSRLVHLTDAPQDTQSSDPGVSEISGDSDYYPLSDIYEQLRADDYQLGFQILLQHLPVTYFALISQYRTES